MTKEELGRKMREVLRRAGKSNEDIEQLVPFILGQPFMQTDETRLIFFNQWKEKL